MLNIRQEYFSTVRILEDVFAPQVWTGGLVLVCCSGRRWIDASGSVTRGVIDTRIG